MADVTRPVRLREQIWLVAGLRWRILRNGLRRKSNVADLVGMIFLSLIGAALVIGPSLAFYFLGKTFVTPGRLRWMPLPFWGIFIFWQIFPVFAMSFGSAFEFRKLLRFPLTASAFYLIGLAYGLADFPAVASTCWLLALSAGIVVEVPGMLPVMLTVVGLFVLLNATIERLVSSWLERLLARRRTREVFFGFFLLTMFSLQFISPMQRMYGTRFSVGRFLAAMKYLAPFPPSLGSRVIVGAISHRPTDMLLGVSGLLAFAILFSLLLWQRFLMQYRGEELSEGVAPQVRRVPARAATNRVAIEASIAGSSAGAAANRRFGLLPLAVGGVVAKELFYLMRNGFGFLLLVLPPAQMLFFSTQFAGRHPLFSGKGFSAENFFPAMMAYTVLMLMGPAYNAFAFEGRGILAYFMAPVKFSEIFVGKNLVSASVMALEVALCASVLAWRVGWPSPPVLCATIAGLIFTIAGQLPIANWSSLNFPRKLEFGSMRNQRNSGAAVWMMFGVQLVMGGISALVLSAGRWTGNSWLPAEAFIFLAAAAVAGYFASLEPLAGFAEKKKESLIETLCR
jgi:ABC-2 type transport system permease protein